MYKLNLKEIPDEGRTFAFSTETGEITEELADLLAGRSFETQFHIRPVGQAYEVSGFLKASVDQPCVRCGWELNLPVERRFHEFLIDEKDRPRGSQSVHGNQSVDFEADNVDYTLVKGDQFFVGEFFHEMIAFLTPFYPSCDDSSCKHLLEMQKRMMDLEKEADGALQDADNSFGVLKNLLPDR